MRIGVLYNTAETGGSPGTDQQYVADAIANTKNVTETLIKNGHQTDLYQITNKGLDQEIKRLAKKVDVVFNLTESVGQKLVLRVISSLEKHKVPYVGANRSGQILTSDKLILKNFLTSHNFPTPKAQFFKNGKERIIKTLRYPLIIKSAIEHGSISIHQESVVDNPKDARKQIQLLLEKYHNTYVLAEEFIDGKEINASVYGSLDWTNCLPLSEVDFIGSYNNLGKWKICTYEANYNKGTPEYNDSPSKLVDWLSKKEEEYIKNLSMTICKMTECFDYARLDIRYHPVKKIPYIIDVNSYPCLKDIKEDTITISRRALGIGFAHFLEILAKSGIKRSTC